jgi:hypothetical protein
LNFVILLNRGSRTNGTVLPGHIGPFGSMCEFASDCTKVYVEKPELTVIALLSHIVFYFISHNNSFYRNIDFSYLLVFV